MIILLYNINIKYKLIIINVKYSKFVQEIVTNAKYSYTVLFSMTPIFIFV